MPKKKKIKRRKKTADPLSLEKLPSTLSKFYQSYKKQKEINDLRKIKLQEREEAKNIVQEKKKLSSRTEKLKKKKKD